MVDTCADMWMLCTGLELRLALVDPAEVYIGWGHFNNFGLID